jgi:hypothetical protein
MKDQESLIRALCDMGFRRDQIEVHETAQRIRGYHEEDDKVGHVIIRRKNSKIPSDIGWERNKDGNYVAHVDAYQYCCATTHYDDTWQQRLTVKYNYEVSKMALDAQGIAYSESRNSAGETVIEAEIEDATESTQIMNYA